MKVTQYPDINELLNLLLAKIKNILGKKLVGLYLYGSLVWGDFDHEVSDIDLLAVISTDITDEEFNELDKMQIDFVNKYKEWNDRVEIAYLSERALKTFKTHASKIAIISPGEPFHVKKAGNDWLINWYIVQEKGLTLFGPAPESLITPISKEEFIQAVKVQAKDWKEWINRMRKRKQQAYAILTMCRALYASKFSEQVSKKQAAIWVEKELPKWSSLIRNALLWRKSWRDKKVDDEKTFPETKRFVHDVIDQILAE